MDNFLQIENRHTGEVLRMRRMRDSDGQIVLAIEGSLPPKMSGPPLHVHRHQPEEGVVKSGSLGAQIGNRKITLRAGETGVFPAGVVHKWWNARDDVLEFNGRAVPAADFDRFVQALFAILNASESGRPSMFYLAHVLWRHRHTQAVVIPPQIVQRIFFPVIVFIGSVLGKYRGDQWSGSPGSCAGAPEA